MMPQSLHGRVALVTGGAVRVGRAISMALARDGFAVAVNYHGSADQALELQRELSAEGHRVVAIQADITDAAATEQLVDAAERQLGPIDLLVNNAALFERRQFLSTDDDCWRRHMALNLEAPFRVCRRVARGMRQRGRGRIVNVCGTVGIQPAGEYIAYRVAKAGLDELTRTLAAALAPEIQVNGVAPGAILFPEGTGERERLRVLARVPAGHVGCPGDLAEVILFFAHAPAYVTGTILPVDGAASVGRR